MKNNTLFLVPRILIFIAAFVLVFGSCKNLKPEEVKIEISQILHQQQSAWNQGDIDGFMEAYWHNDSLLFISGDKVGHGWQRTLDNYKKNYPTAEIMGTLTFDILHFEMLSEESCFIAGSWNLERISGPIGGKFTLVWKKINGKWVIVSDHTS